MQCWLQVKVELLYVIYGYKVSHFAQSLFSLMRLSIKIQMLLSISLYLMQRIDETPKNVFKMILVLYNKTIPI